MKFDIKNNASNICIYIYVYVYLHKWALSLKIFVVRLVHLATKFETLIVNNCSQKDVVRQITGSSE